MKTNSQKTTNITTYAYDILSPGELQTYLPAWRSIFVVSELSRRKTVQTDSSGTIRYRNEIRPLIPPAQEKSAAEKLLWEYMSQLTNNLKEQIAPEGKDAGAEYFPPDFPADFFSQSNWKVLTLEPEAHDKIPGLIKTWKAVLRPVLDAFAEITILGVTLTKKILLPIEGATLTVRFAGNLVTDLDIASPIALKTTRKTEPLKIAAEHLVYVTSEKILEMLEFGFRKVDGGLRVREMRGEEEIKMVEDYPLGATGLWVFDLDGNFVFWEPYEKNEIHFLSLGMCFWIGKSLIPYWGAKDFQKRYAEYIRQESTAFIGINTFNQTKKILDEFPEKHRLETGGLMFISEGGELLPHHLEEVGSTPEPDWSRISWDFEKWLKQNDDYGYQKLREINKPFFCLFHSHPTRIEPSSKETGGDLDYKYFLTNIKNDVCPKSFQDTIGIIIHERGLEIYRTSGDSDVKTQSPVWGDKNDNSEGHRKKFNITTIPKGVESISTAWEIEGKWELQYFWFAVNQDFFKSEENNEQK